MSATFSVHRKIEEFPAVAVHGQVFTKAHVVQLILDLVGYVPGESDLNARKLIDPGCGEGAFLIEAATRLLQSASDSQDYTTLETSLLGIEKDPAVAEACKENLVAALVAGGVPNRPARKLSHKWVVTDDFLKHDFETRFDFVVGNPPYVRQEAIPKSDLERYRRDFECFYDRADLYVAFMEKGLGLLSAGGVLGYICPDRFARNKYGKKLRSLITHNYCLRHVLDLSHASPFEPEVCSYPGIFIIGTGTTTRVDHVTLEEAGPKECEAAHLAIVHGKPPASDKAAPVGYHRYDSWFTGEQQWATESPAHLALLRRIEQNCVALGDKGSGCKVGIGVATGADEVFIVRPEDVEIEPELLLPLVTTGDITTGRVAWSGRCVINPFAPNVSGELIDLAEFPMARRYFVAHKAQLQKRNVAQRDQQRWYRTIDRIYPELTRCEKLLVPDIKARNVVAFENGRLYPHHNLYYITSNYWDLRALRTILRSSVAKFFVWMYGVKMRAGFLRFQAQYLRKICIPEMLSVPRTGIKKLRGLNDAADVGEIDAVVQSVYGLADAEMELIRDIPAPV